ncbi:helicase domain-containing protein [Ardenticatena maritima]|uniref:Uncharacterized protein n=2 Tax=Ardenticatena maritima TaxID=872965 RepID=A0A0P6Y8C9_9CHLR|nr:hypothetical protein [Ardenticatena maritima]KPL89101.1 hypothetical protein SE16_00740 [Ardenticatena maritima]
MLVYVTDHLKEQLADKQFKEAQSGVQKLQSRLESITDVYEIAPSVMERLHPVYKYRIGKIRVIGKLIYENEIPVMILVHLFKRGDAKYQNFLNMNAKERLDFIDPYLPAPEVIQKFIEENLAEVPQVEERPPLPSEFAHWLNPFQRSRQDVIIFESRNWVQKMEMNRYRATIHRYFDILNKAIISQKYDFPVIDFISGVREEHRVVYLANFLLDLPNYPSEEIFFLIDASEGRDEELEHHLKQGLREGTGPYAWLNGISDGIVSTELQFDLLAQQSGRAYYAYFLLDEPLWKEIEGVKTTQSSNSGVDHRNPALSAEEVRILSHALHGGDQYVLPLFINGRAGSGKSTMLHYLFANYVFRKLQDELPGKVLFLTYTEQLRKESQKTVREFLQIGNEFAIKDLPEREFERIMQTSFWKFDDFVREMLSQEERLEKFPLDRFVANFGDFQRVYETIAPKGPGNYSADVAWHILRTYIKGYRRGDPLEPDEYYEEVSEKERSVPLDAYKWVWEKIWPRYRDEYWDIQDVVRYLIQQDRVPAEYAVVFCDEAQDFTRVELEFLWLLLVYREYDLKHSGYKLRIPLVLAGDPFQTLNPTGFRWEALKNAFSDEIEGALDPAQFGIVGFCYEELRYNYRSAAPIVRFGNLLQYWRRTYFEVHGEIWQKPWQHDQHFLPPQLYVLGKMVTEETLLQKLQGEIVILPCEHNQEEEFVAQDPLLRQLQQQATPPTFLSPMAAKGLEFSRVWLYKFGEYCPENFFKSDNIPYDERLRNEFFLNKLYVSVTRAQRSLNIIDTEEGKRRLWDKALTLPPVEEKDLLGSITIGDVFGLQEGAEQLDPMELAEQFLASGRPHLVRQAGEIYRRSGKMEKSNYCRAYALELERKYREAGKQYLELGILYFKDAERCFWNSQDWEQLDALYTTGWEGQGNVLYRRATSLMRAQQTLEQISLQDIQLFLDALGDELKRDDSVLEHESIKQVLRFVADLIRQRFENTEYVQLLRRLASLLRENPGIGVILGDEMAGWVCYYAGEIEASISFWDALAVKPHEYYLAQASISKDDTAKLRWLGQGQAYEQIVDLKRDLQNDPQRVKALSEEHKKLIGRALVQEQQYNEAFDWYRENGLLEDALTLLEKGWIEPTFDILKQFLEEVLNLLSEAPSDKTFEFAEKVSKLIQEHLVWRDGNQLLTEYWDQLGNTNKEWEWVVESFKRTKGEYNKKAYAMLAHVVAKAQPFSFSSVRQKQLLVEILLQRLSPKASQAWLQTLPLDIAVTALDKITTHLDALRWYEEMLEVGNLSDSDRAFIQKQWLKTKEERIEYKRSRGESTKKDEEELEQKKKEWKTVDVLASSSEKATFSHIERPESETDMEVKIDVEVDEDTCKLSSGNQIVLINVTNQSITSFKVKVLESRKGKSLRFRVKEWNLQGELGHDRTLKLFINRKLWKKIKI